MFDCFGREEGIPIWIEYGNGEAEEVGDVGKESGMTACTVEQKCVLVLNLALNAPLTEELVLFGRRDLGTEMRRGTVAGRGHSEREEDFTARPGCEFFAKDGFERLAEQNEAGIGIFGAGSGFRLDGQLQAAAQHRVGRGRSVKEGDISGKSGVMGEEMANGHPPRVLGRVAANDKAGKQLSEGCIEVEQSTLMKEHGRGGRGDDLGKASHVVERFGGD
jgi:hypothetical protein